MRWLKINKKTSVQPRKGDYPDWKDIIAEEGGCQCVYCAISETNFGGRRNFHIEHYKPKSKFPALIKDIKNLFYSCAVCNVFKSNDWPNEPKNDFSNTSYANPSDVDYNELFVLPSSTGEIESEYVTGKYMLNKINLNRGQLIIERRIFNLNKKLGCLQGTLLSQSKTLSEMGGKEASALLHLLNVALNRLVELYRNPPNKTYDTSAYKR